MKSLGHKANILKVSRELQSSLEAAGKIEHFPPASVIFHANEESAGVFLVCKGRVRMTLKHLPRFDRDFGQGSLLGLPSTFTGNRYTLSAVTMEACEIVHVAREEFLQIMREQPELCREATDMLSREVAFIHQIVSARHSQFVKSVARGADFTITFDPGVPPEGIKATLSALADYYRACGGIGLRIEDFDFVRAAAEELVYA